MKTYHLRVAQVRGTNQDSTPKIEENVIKLTHESGLRKFLKALEGEGFYPPRSPKIVNIWDSELENKETQKLGAFITDQKEIDKAQAIVEELLKPPVQEKSTDYKALLEIEKKRNDSLEARLKALEAKSEGLVIGSEEETVTDPGEGTHLPAHLQELAGDGEEEENEEGQNQPGQRFENLKDAKGFYEELTGEKPVRTWTLEKTVQEIEAFEALQAQ